MTTIRPSTIRSHEPIVHGAASRARRGAPAVTAGRVLAVTLLVSFALRGLLIYGGGQFYWPDESRYRTSRRVAAFVMRGAGDKAVQNLDDAEHVLFKAIAVAPALIEYLMYCEAGTADEECVDHAIEDSARIPAFFFALFSVANIALLAAVGRNLGADRTEAVGASIFMAVSSALFYWSRHLVPYDVAMTLGLLALCAGTRNGRPMSTVLCGVLAGCTFLTYAGYWTLGGAAILVHLGLSDTGRDLVRRMSLVGTALGGTIGAVVLTSATINGGFIRGIVRFSATVVQGSFEEGLTLPFEYLWHSEHLLLFAWIAATAFWTVRPFHAWQNRRVRVGLIGLLFVFGSLVVGSVFLHKFVVYGRLARQTVPFFALLSAAALSTLWALLPVRSIAAAVVAATVLLVQTAWNFREPLSQSFPNDFLEGGHLAPGVTALYAHHIYPRPEKADVSPHDAVIKAARHPLQFLPYQYEGYTPEERRALRTTDIRMRIIAARH